MFAIVDLSATVKVLAATSRLAIVDPLARISARVFTSQSQADTLMVYHSEQGRFLLYSMSNGSPLFTITLPTLPPLKTEIKHALAHWDYWQDTDMLVACSDDGGQWLHFIDITRPK